MKRERDTRGQSTVCILEGEEREKADGGSCLLRSTSKILKFRRWTLSSASRRWNKRGRRKGHAFNVLSYAISPYVLEKRNHVHGQKIGRAGKRVCVQKSPRVFHVMAYHSLL